MKGQHAAATESRKRGDKETRDRLLRVAERLFADRGFRDVTVRDICRAARANVAAVNYHFGDKLGLYRFVLGSAIQRMRATNEAARAAGAGQSSEEQLRRYITIFLSRLLASGNDTVHRLVTRELNDPTPALDDLIEEGIKPRIEYLSALIADIMGCEPTDRRVLRCVASIQMQSLAYVPNAIAERMGLASRPTSSHVQEVARHIADFSIAGIRAIGGRRTGGPERQRYAEPEARTAARSLKSADAVAGRSAGSSASERANTAAQAGRPASRSSTNPR